MFFLRRTWLCFFPCLFACFSLHISFWRLEPKKSGFSELALENKEKVWEHHIQWHIQKPTCFLKWFLASTCLCHLRLRWMKSNRWQSWTWVYKKNGYQVHKSKLDIRFTKKVGHLVGHSHLDHRMFKEAHKPPYLSESSHKNTQKTRVQKNSWNPFTSCHVTKWIEPVSVHWRNKLKSKWLYNNKHNGSLAFSTACMCIKYN